MKKLLASVATTIVCAFAAAAIAAPAAWATDENNGETTGESPYASLMAHGVTKDAATDTDPYGYGKDTPFMLTTYDELAVDLTSDDGCGFQAHGGYQYSSSAAPESSSSYTYNKTLGSASVTHKFVQEVAFDPTNSGRNDHIAYVGFDQENRVLAWVYDAQTGKESNAVELSSDASWIFDDAEAWAAENYLAITAGDYDADNIETVVVSAPRGKGETPLLHELTLTETSDKLTLQEKGNSSELLNQALIESGKVNSKLLYTMGSSLATGDVNADDIDDLVVYSGSCASVYASDSSVKAEALVPQLSISWGGKNVSNILADHTVELDKSTVQGVCTKVLWSKDDETSTQSSSDYTYSMLYCAGVDAGDVDGDKCDEIVVAGYTCDIVSNESGTVEYSRKNMTSSKLGCMLLHYNSFDSTYTTQGIQTVTANKWTESGSYATGISGDNVLAQIGVKTFAINGSTYPEAVFISGTVYDCSSYTFQEAYTPDYFKNSNDTPSGMLTSTNTYITSVAAGNFDHNAVGREQLAFGLGLRARNLSETRYYCKVGILGGTDYDDKDATETTEATYGKAKNYYCNTGSYLAHVSADDYTVLNLNVVAADFNKDGVQARFSRMDTMASDPKVEAVLQAAPFFSELSGTEGTTTYGTSQTNTITNGNANSTSVGVGYAGTFSSPAWRVAVTAGPKGGYSHSWENSYKTSYSEKFTAKDKTTVVMNRTDVNTYLYDVYNADTGTWEKQTLAVQALAQPEYTQLTVAQYNEFVDEYNAQADELNAQNNDELLVPSYTTAAAKKVTDVAKVTKLNKLDENTYSFLSSSGAPWGYATTWSDGTQISKSAYAMNSGTGSITSNYSTETGESTKNTSTAGFSTNVTVQWGIKVGDWQLYNGINVSVSYDHQWSVAKTATRGVDTGGTVSNIDAAKLGISDQVASSYGFSWTLGQWMFSYDEAGNRVPVVGYVVSKLKAPPLPVSNLKARALGSSVIQLTWTQASSTARAAATGYQVYEVTDNGYTLVAEVDGADATYCTIEGLASGTKHTYVVSPLCATSETTLYGLYSNQASATTLSGYYTLTFSTDDHCSAVFTHSGNVRISSGDELLQGVQVHGKVQANACYQVDSVQMTVDGKTTPVTLSANGTFDFLMDSNVAIAVTSHKVDGKALLSVDTQGPGTLTVTDQNGAALASGAELTCGDKLTVKATPEEGYELLGLTVNGKDADDGCTVQVEGDVAVSAVFGKTALLSVSAQGPGTLTVTDQDGVALTDGAKVTCGSVLTVHATPEEGYQLLGLTVNGKDADDSCTVQVEGNVAVSAVFGNTALLAIDAQGPGQLAVTDQDGNTLASGAKLTWGDVLTVHAAPDDGYVLLSLTINGEDAEEGCTLQVAEDVAVSAVFGKLDLSNAVVKVASSVTYKGYACTPAVTVTLNGSTLPSSSYTVTYSGNTAPGVARATVTGASVYAGSASASFLVCGTGSNAIGLNAGLRVTMNSKSLKVTWGKVPGAQGYDVFARPYGKKFGRAVKVANTSATQARIPLSVIGSKGTCYKAKVWAWRMVDGKKVYLEKSLMVHVAKKSARALTNASYVWVAKSVRTLKVGSTAKVGARTIKKITKRKLISPKRVSRLRYWSTNKAVATVSKSGKIKAVGKGACTVFAMAQNGKKAIVVVTVE